MRLRQASVFALFTVMSSTDATHLKLRGQLDPTSFVKRAGVSGSSGLTDSQDIRYSVTTTMNGQQFSLLIDTGSTDTYVAGTVSNAVDTGFKSNITFASGPVFGNVKKATMIFDDNTINNQAYLEIPPDDSNAVNTGLIGLGPVFGSSIKELLPGSDGRPPLDNIFNQNVSTPNFISILLGRSDDPDNKFPGDITVGSLIPGYENVTNQPKLEVGIVSTSQRGNQHWQTLLDTDGLLGPDGKVIPIQTKVTNSKSSQATVVFDSGFSLPQVPADVAEAIYGRISGARLQNIQGLSKIWTIPCTAEINITFIFKGVKFPIHPLDTNFLASDLGLQLSGNNQCLGVFQPVSFDSTFGSGVVNFDMILGMGFLRNAYLMVNFGDFVDGGRNTADPFIQLLPTTNDTANAHKDFVTVRLNGQDTTGTQTLGPNTATNGGASGSSTRVNIPLIAGIAGGVVALLIIVGLLFACCRKRRGSKTSSLTGGQFSSYRPLDAPAPQGYTYPPNNAQGPYAPQQPFQPNSNQQYSTAWDARP